VSLPRATDGILGRIRTLDSTPFGREVKPRYSPAWLWWKYVNYGGQELGGCWLIGMGLIPLTGISLISLMTVIFELPFWLEGKETQGTITNKATHLRPAGKGRKTTAYDVTYDFSDPAGKLHHGNGDLDRERWNAAQVGGKISIEYLPGAPQRNRPVARSGRLDAGCFLVLSFFFLIGSGLTYGGAKMLAAGIHTLRRRVQLIATGQATAGLIDGLEPVGKNPNLPLACNCSYRYYVPAQNRKPSRIFRGKLSIHPRLAKRLRPGDLLLIVFDPEQPEDHTVDVHRARFENPADLLPGGK
jgi:hypothetical protein